MGFKKFLSQDQLIGNVTMDFIRHDSTRYCTAIGEAGTLRWDAINSKVALLKAGETSWSDLFNVSTENNSYEAEWRHFLEIVKINGEPIVNGFDALSTLKIIEAIKISSMKKKRIFLD
jgi:predicted dehydrogenase